MHHTIAAPTSPTEWTDAEIDRLLAHPYWEALGTELDALIGQLAATSEACERTTILSWIYQQGGAMSFLEISERITGYRNTTASKRQLRYMLRGLEKLLLVRVVNFPGRQGARGPAAEDVLGQSSLVSLTWTGMIWLRRAWQARATLARDRELSFVHRCLVEEEDEGKANAPYWIENISGADPEGAVRRAQRITEAMPSIASVFELARATRP